jgi:hypothetical protein
MELQWGCLVFYKNHEILVAIGVGYWNDVSEKIEGDTA